MKLLVLYGSRACEHDVSIITAVQAMDNANTSKYDIVPVYIDRKGRWFTGDALRKMDFYTKFDESKVTPCMIVVGADGKAQLCKTKKSLFSGSAVITDIDCALMAFHGMNGEDGTVQGMLELYGIPYTSAGVLGSATGMDKIAMKLIYKGCGLPVLPMSWFERGQWNRNHDEILDRVEKEVGYPAFVKPANLGSSIGISKAKDRKSLEEAIETACAFDRRILVEVGVEQLEEVNCAAVGYGDEVIPSVCEMPVSWEDFLTFDDKYMRGGKGGKGGSKGGGKGGMAQLARKIPAPISDEMTQSIRSMTLEIFRVMDLKGVVRVDYIIDKKTNNVYVNEVNTIPGSLAFYLFEPLGIKFSQLIDKMVDAALRAHKEKQASSFSFGSQILNKVSGGAKR